MDGGSPGWAGQADCDRIGLLWASRVLELWSVGVLSMDGGACRPLGVHLALACQASLHAR